MKESICNLRHEVLPSLGSPTILTVPGSYWYCNYYMSCGGPGVSKPLHQGSASHCRGNWSSGLIRHEAVAIECDSRVSLQTASSKGN